MKTLVLIAEEGERKLLAQYLPQCETSSDYEVLVTGVGALNIVRSLRDVPRDTPLLNIGYAGSANFAIGSVVCVNEVSLHHPNVTYNEPTLHLSTDALKMLKDNDIEPLEAKCYSSCDFVLQSPYKNCVFDMELAYIAALGFERLCSIKIVSDNLSLHDYREFGSGVESTQN